MSTSEVRREVDRLEQLVEWNVSDPVVRHRLLCLLDDAWAWAWERPGRSLEMVGRVRDVLNGTGSNDD